MAIEHHILFGRVMHKRLFPKVNALNYGIYYLGLSLGSLSQKIENRFFKLNRFGLLSFYFEDHGGRNTDDPKIWSKNILHDHNIQNVDDNITLVTMPRVLGYVFNPVSFWFCHDKEKKLRAVICEVNNTFGETHNYLCANDDGSEITADDIIKGQKLFHVSPFLKREGHYTFRFNIHNNKMGIWIDYYDTDGVKQLITALTGRFVPFSQKSCRHAFFAYPLVTLKAIALIHWHALKLIVKGIKYIPKPDQKPERLTQARKTRPK